MFESLKEWCLAYGYPVLFAGVLLENAGIPVPGETVVLIAGLLASKTGDYRFNLGTVMVIVIVAAILGDNLGYYLGRVWARPRLASGRRFLFLTPAALGRAERYFRRYGSWTIFFARFITGLRVVGAVAAGTAAMPWPRFVVANGAGAVVWAVAISLLGFYFGENLPLLNRWLHRSGWMALAAIVVAFVAFRLWRSHARRRRLPATAQVPESSADHPPLGTGSRPG